MQVVFDPPHSLEDDGVMQDVTAGAARADRSLVDRIRYPSGGTVIVAAVLSFIPLAWPLLLYVGLRYLTGHRAPGSSAPPVRQTMEEVPGSGMPTMTVAETQEIWPVAAPAAIAAPASTPAPALTPAPASTGISLPRLAGAAIGGVALSVAASVALAMVRVPPGAGVVGGMIIGTLASGYVIRAKSPSRWAAAAAIVVVGQLLLGTGIILASGAMGARPSGTGPSGQPAVAVAASPAAEPSPTAPRPTLPSQATPRPSPTATPHPIGWACAFSAHPSTHIWIFPATEVAQDCAWLEASITLDPGETTQVILNPSDLVPTDPIVCEFLTTGSHVTLVTDTAKGHVVGDSLCKIFGAPAKVSAFTQRGQAYYLDGKYDLAVADLNKAIDLDPTNAAAFTVRGYANTNAGALDLALADLTKAIDLDPTIAVGFQGRGGAYYLEGKYDLAIADFTRSIELDPKVVMVYAARGQAYLNGSKYDLAIADFSEAIKLDPGDASSFLSRGNAYRNDGQLDRAITDYTKAIELDPSSPWAFEARGGARGANGDLAGATDDFERALSLTSDPALISNIKAVRCSVGLACE